MNTSVFCLFSNVYALGAAFPQAVADSPDIREELTAPLKEKINAGTYNVSSESFADKLMKKYNESENLSF